jgi:hypothetical protein
VIPHQAGAVAGLARIQNVARKKRKIVYAVERSLWTLIRARNWEKFIAECSHF